MEVLAPEGSVAVSLFVGKEGRVGRVFGRDKIKSEGVVRGCGELMDGHC